MHRALALMVRSVAAPMRCVVIDRCARCDASRTMRGPGPGCPLLRDGALRQRGGRDAIRCLAAPRHGQQRQSVSKVTACGGLAGFNRGGASPAVLELEARIAKLRDTVQRYAKDCAPYRHPQLQAIAHKHLSADGAPICPVVNLVVMQPAERSPSSLSRSRLPSRSFGRTLHCG